MKNTYLAEFNDLQKNEIATNCENCKKTSFFGFEILKLQGIHEFST